MDWVNTDPHWVEDVWQGRFTLEWLSFTELPFEGVKHVPVKETTPGFRAISCFDGQEISRGSAWELLRAYSAEERRLNVRASYTSEDRRLNVRPSAVAGVHAALSAQVQS
jgi:hypothetical protein